MVAFIDAGDSNRELEIFQLIEADIDGVGQMIGKKEESRRVCYNRSVPDPTRSEIQYAVETYRICVYSSRHTHS